MSSARLIDSSALPAFAVVLDLGTLVYFSFRGRNYRVRQSARPALVNGRPRDLPHLLWRHAEPGNKGGRLLRTLGLLRNPFTLATDQERRAMQHFVQVDMARMRSPQLSPRGVSLDMIRHPSRPKES